MDNRQFEKRLFDVACVHFPAGAAILCGVSGGADSMALLHGLVRVNRMRRFGWKLHVAHLDHHIPHNSAEIMTFVSDAAASLGLPCMTDDEDVPALSRRTRESIETAGRRVRYEFLEEVARRVGAKIIAVAHHADDQAETVLHRLVRGTGLRGLGGMSVRRPIEKGSEIEIVRPMLGFRRKELVAYLKKRGLEYRHDVTNDDPHVATRNRYRRVIIPMLEESMNPRVVDAVLRLAEQAQRAQAVVDRLADAAATTLIVSRKKDQIVVAARELAGLESAVGTAVIHLILDQLQVPLNDVSAERLDAILAVCRADGRKRKIQLASGFVAERRGSLLRVGRVKADDVRASRSTHHGRKIVLGS